MRMKLNHFKLLERDTKELFSFVNNLIIDSKFFTMEFSVPLFIASLKRTLKGSFPMMPILSMQLIYSY